MIPFPTLQVPVVVAPMAGGPSTPALVAAVCAAGVLAAGYRTADEILTQIEQTRELTDSPFGVNVFVPTADSVVGTTPAQKHAMGQFRQRLLPLAAQLRVDLPAVDWADDDGFDAKIDTLEQARVAMVSFTFGVPGAEVIERLHAVDTCVVVMVTDADEATAAARAGADALIVQGDGAGGHRGTHAVQAIPSDRGWREILRETRTVTRLPLIVAGAIMSARDTRLALDSGAVAVAVLCGTAFLLADEAGTSAAHRAGLQGGTFDQTVVGRSFSGRPARSLRNEFVDRYGDLAPAIYPAVSQVTAPLRAAAARLADPQGVALWAGTGWQSAHAGPAAEIVATLLP